MSGNVNAIVLDNHRVHHEFEGNEIVSTAADGVVKMTREAFDDAVKFGAVRRATADDRDADVAVAGEPPVMESVEVRASTISEDAPKGRRG